MPVVLSMAVLLAQVAATVRTCAGRATIQWLESPLDGMVVVVQVSSPVLEVSPRASVSVGWQVIESKLLLTVLVSRKPPPVLAVNDRVKTVPVRLAVIVPQERVSDAVWAWRGLDTDLDT